MRQYFVSIGIVATVACAVFLLCTIKDDAGWPIAPGQEPPPPSTPIIIDSAEPVLIMASVPQNIPIGDTISIYVTVVKDTILRSTSQPYENALVTVTASSGWISDDSLIADRNGRAVLRYSSKQEASAVQVVLRCRGAQRTLRFAVTNQATQVQKLIEVHASRSSVKADGKDACEIRVTVIDENHNPVVGEAIQFVSTAGVIAGTNPPEPSKSGQSVTDKNGVATAVLKSSNINDTAFITVYMVSNLTMSDETQVAFLGVSIVATVDSANLSQGGRTTITAQVLNASNEPIARTPIFFKLGKGVSSPLSFISGLVDTITGFDGTARATVVAGSVSGTDSVVISAAGAQTTLFINVTNLILTAIVSAPVMQANSKEIDTLTVTFRNSSGAPLNNKYVRVVTSHVAPKGNLVIDTLPTKTTTNGICRFMIPSLPYEATMRLEVTAYGDTGQATVHVFIEFMATRQITTNAVPPVILADGTSKSTITVNVKNENNNPIAGDTLLFTSTAGMVQAYAVTDDNGRASVSLTSDRRNTVATVKVVLKKDPTVTDSMLVEFSGVELRLTTVPQSISSNESDTCIITATLQDAMKNVIVGERIFFSKQQAATRFVWTDSVTNNRGTAIAKIVGTGTGVDTIGVSSAGARANAVLYYSSHFLQIDTVPLAGRQHSYIANGSDTTTITIRYRKGDKITPIPNAIIEASVTLGTIADDKIDTIFASTLRTDASGNAFFNIVNPKFANWATINIKAITAEEITTSSMRIYFKADVIAYIELSGTPEVISTNGARAKITAIVYDAQRNRVKDATIAFNLLNGPGGGEYLDPPTAVSGIDGSAVTYLVSGPQPSNYRQVWVGAGDFSAIKSNIIKFTIAGPPAYITIRRQIGEVIKYPNGTYGLKCAALVTDINGNPVADGTEVTFSAKITGYCIFPKKVIWRFVNDAYRIGYGWYEYDIVFESNILVFEDLNDNFSGDNPEPGEDRNRDGYANRGEDINGDGIFQPGPGFEDIDWNGIRNRDPEPCRTTQYYSQIMRPDSSVTWILRDTTVCADLNGNNRYDIEEPLLGNSQSVAYWKSFPGYSENQGDPYLGGYPDIDWNNNGIADPATTIIIKRTAQTQNGIAENELIYGQSDALRIRAMITAESHGKIASPEEFVLPIASEDRPRWSPR